MTNKPQDAFQQAMAEAALLSPNDPIRQEIEARARQEGGATLRAWEEALASTHQLHLALAQIAIPPGFHQRLYAMPDLIESTSPPSRHRRWVAAIAALFLLGIWVFWLFLRPAVPSSHLYNLALLAMNDHMKRSPLTVVTSDWTELATRLRPALSFPPQRPEGISSLRLQGGRRCILGTRPVLLSTWRGSQGRLSLFQFRPGDFKLASHLPKTRLHPQPPSIEKHSCQVLIWIEKNVGYILVANGDFPSFI